jgi:hypothetical protein
VFVTFCVYFGGRGAVQTTARCGHKFQCFNQASRNCRCPSKADVHHSQLLLGPTASWLAYKTTADNLGGHPEAIPLERLPQIYREAIEVTLALGLRYTWIDALCIVQFTDDLTGWQIESAQMASIFQGSFLVLAASSSPDSYRVFF